MPQPGGPYRSNPLTRSAPSSSSTERGAHSGVHTRLLRVRVKIRVRVRVKVKVRVRVRVKGTSTPR